MESLLILQTKGISFLLALTTKIVYHFWREISRSYPKNTLKTTRIHGLTIVIAIVKNKSTILALVMSEMKSW